jgi:acyl carrier protein
VLRSSFTSCFGDIRDGAETRSADWLDPLELMIMIEDRFGGLEITDDGADQIKVVGDLIRYVETWVNTGQKR